MAEMYAITFGVDLCDNYTTQSKLQQVFGNGVILGIRAFPGYKLLFLLKAECILRTNAAIIHRRHRQKTNQSEEEKLHGLVRRQ